MPTCYSSRHFATGWNSSTSGSSASAVSWSRSATSSPRTYAHDGSSPQGDEQVTEIEPGHVHLHHRPTVDEPGSGTCISLSTTSLAAETAATGDYLPEHRCFGVHATMHAGTDSTRRWRRVSVFTDDGTNQHASIDACGRERS